MPDGKFRIAYKGTYRGVKKYFNETQKGETFDFAFHRCKNKSHLLIGKQIDSYDLLYSLYRSRDGKFILTERCFNG